MNSGNAWWGIYPPWEVGDRLPIPRGWACPRCGKVLSPWTSSCDCTLDIQYTKNITTTGHTGQNYSSTSTYVLGTSDKYSQLLEGWIADYIKQRHESDSDIWFGEVIEELHEHHK